MPVLMSDILPLEIHFLTLKVLNLKSSLLKFRYSWDRGEPESFLNYHLGKKSTIAGLRAAALKELGQKSRNDSVERKEICYVH